MQSIDIDAEKVIERLSQRIANLVRENATLSVIVSDLSEEHAKCGEGEQ